MKASSVAIWFFYLLALGSSIRSARTTSTPRQMYDSMSKLVTGQPYPSIWWEERVACMNFLSPTLEATMENAWSGMQEYWTSRGTENDTWHECGAIEMMPQSSSGWFENNCTRQPDVPMDIWEPCNYVSNLAYDRLMVEMCLQQDWTFDQETVSKIAQAFHIVTFGSSFFHGSQTHNGATQDGFSNQLFPYIIYQAGVSNIPYDPVIHDLTYEPRAATGAQAVDIILDAYNNAPVDEWDAIQAGIDLPNLQRTFAGIFGYIVSLLLDPDTGDQLLFPFLDLLGVDQEDRDFFILTFLPAIRKVSSSHYLGLRDRLQLWSNTLATVAKLGYAFIWQEAVIDLGGANLTPEANQAGAEFLPYFNQLMNNRTSWSLAVQDVQDGKGYPGHELCNPVIPHAKWHVETSAALADVALLMDSVLALMSQA